MMPTMRVKLYCVMICEPNTKHCSCGVVLVEVHNNEHIEYKHQVKPTLNVKLPTDETAECKASNTVFQTIPLQFLTCAFLVGW